MSMIEHKMEKQAELEEERGTSKKKLKVFGTKTTQFSLKFSRF